MRQQQHAHEPTYLWASAVPPRVFHAKFRGANDNEPTDALSLYPGLICGASQFRDISRVPRRSAARERVRGEWRASLPLSSLVCVSLARVALVASTTHAARSRLYVSAVRKLQW